MLENFYSIAHDKHRLTPPYTIEMGAIGLQGARLGIGIRNLSGQIHQNMLTLRRVLTDTTPSARRKLIDELLDELFDLAGEDPLLLRKQFDNMK